MSFLYVYLGCNLLCFERANGDVGFQVDGGWILFGREAVVWRAHISGRITCSLCSHAYLGRNSLHFERAKQKHVPKAQKGTCSFNW